jgi:uncharacterized membrane protein
MRWAGLGLLAAAAAVLRVRWASLPARWAVHWGAGDRPNGWVEKSATAALAPLLLGAVLWAVIEGLGAATRRGSRNPAELKAAEGSLIHGLSAAVGFSAGFVAVVLPLQPSSSLPLALGALLPLLLAVVLGTRRLRAAMTQARSRGTPGLEGWQGTVYRNPADPRLWVPRLSGLGWTLNFAHRRARPVLLLLLAPAVLAVVITLVIVRR